MPAVLRTGTTRDPPRRVACPSWVPKHVAYMRTFFGSPSDRRAPADRNHTRAWAQRSMEQDGKDAATGAAGTTADSAASRRTLETLVFDNQCLARLPLDKIRDNYPRSPVPGACFSIVDPTPIEQPELVAASLDALSLIGIGDDQVARSDFASYFCGSKVLKGARPAAHCYCGHQFGYFSGQLGDGATMYVGEIVNDRKERWELQFKGAGKTPYSRTADGRKVLRSSIREFLCSEAMHGLGIPTTRAPTLVTSRKTTVLRDIFYNGNARHEQCAVITRLAPSFIRFGSFEIVKPRDSTTGRAGPSAGDAGILTQLLNFTVSSYFPEIWNKHREAKDKSACYLAFYEEVVRRTAKLVAQWQCVGWCHGVLNTDNMSIVGVTIDYGPFGFMERTDPEYICNGSDNDGRYTYKNQPDMCRWNCGKLAEALALCLPVETSKKALDATWTPAYRREYYGRMRAKLGLETNAKEDEKLIDELIGIMGTTGADFTTTFRRLAFVAAEQADPPDLKVRDPLLDETVRALPSLDNIRKTLKPSMPPQQIQFVLMMLRQQPERMQQATLQRMPKLASDIKKLNKLAEMRGQTQEARDTDNSRYWSDWLAKYRARLAAEDAGAEDKKSAAMKRAARMNSVNPKFVLRNYMLQEAIQQAEKGDYALVRALLRLTRDPYAQDPKIVGITPEKMREYAGLPPEWAAKLCVT